MRFDLAYNSPLSGGGIMSYEETGGLGTREMLLLHDLMMERREWEFGNFARAHGCKVE